MTNDELITKQQLEIEELKTLIKENESQKEKVHCLLFNIGAPLNDNLLNFNKEQRRWLYQIAYALQID